MKSFISTENKWTCATKTSKDGVVKSSFEEVEVCRVRVVFLGCTRQQRNIISCDLRYIVRSPWRGGSLSHFALSIFGGDLAKLPLIMSTDAVELPPNLTTAKVHHSICVELMKLVEEISYILPKIEASRPGCLSGVQALCQLSRANENSKSILQSCCESSKLYLAIRGDKLASKCDKWRNSMERSLTQIENMVPVSLSVEISHILDVVRRATFTLDSAEEEAGHALRELIFHNAFIPELRVKSEIEALQIAGSRLHINSPKSLLLEKRSIKKLLGKVSDGELKKSEVLVYLLGILRKHGISVVGETVEMFSP